MRRRRTIFLITHALISRFVDHSGTDTGEAAFSCPGLLSRRPPDEDASLD